MKKLLSILAAVGLTATASSSVVACTQSVSKLHLDVQMDKDGIWGKKSDLKSEELGNADAKNAGAETITNFLDSTVASKSTKKMAKSIKKNLGLTYWFGGEDGSQEPTMESVYMTEKPSFKSGSKQTNAVLEGLKSTKGIDPKSMATNKTVTLYIVLWNKAKNSDAKQKALIVKVTFEAAK